MGGASVIPARVDYSKLPGDKGPWLVIDTMIGPDTIIAHGTIEDVRGCADREGYVLTQNPAWFDAHPCTCPPRPVEPGCPHHDRPTLPADEGRGTG